MICLAERVKSSEVPEYDGEEILTYTTHLFADLDSLTEFTNSQIPSRTYVISPGYINKSENWELQVLKTVSKAEYMNDSRSSYVYRFEFENGDTILHDVCGMAQTADVLNFQTIMQFKS